MSKKLKVGFGTAGFVLLIIAAVIAYNMFKVQVDLDDGIGLASEQDSVSDAADDRQKAPDFNMTDMDGNSVKLSDFTANGKPIVLNFWASWCPPCVSEMPEFEKVYKEVGDEIQFVMLNLETEETGTKHVNDQGYTFPVYFDINSEGRSAYGIKAIPTTLFIDGGGYIIAVVQGAIDEAKLRTGIEMIR